METYGEFRPTPFDHSGAFLPDRQDWFLAPVSQTRDSECIEQSNFATAEAMLAEADPEGNDHESHRFGHWGPGWFEIILIRPGSACQSIGEELEARLEDYPLLDENDLSERELEAESESWEAWSRGEFRRELARAIDPEFGAEYSAVDDAELAELDELWRTALDESGEYVEHCSDGAHFPIDRVVAFLADRPELVAEHVAAFRAELEAKPVACPWCGTSALLAWVDDGTARYRCTSADCRSGSFAP